MNFKAKLLIEVKNCLGVPYLWGGDTKQGFDCSGLMQYLYKKINKDIPRTTFDQIKIGREVNKDELQIGDLIFFGTKDNPRHVGMYVGEDNYVQAPKTGDVVKISNLNDRSDLVCARRILEKFNYDNEELEKAVEETKIAMKEYEKEIQNLNEIMDKLEINIKDSDNIPKEYIKSLRKEIELLKMANLKNEIVSDVYFTLNKLPSYRENAFIENIEENDVSKIVYEDFKRYRIFLDLTRNSLNTYIIINKDLKSDDIEFIQNVVNKIKIELDKFREIKERYKNISYKHVSYSIRIYNELTLFYDRLSEHLEIWKKDINK